MRLRGISMILTKLGSLALVVYVAWLAWENLGPRKPEIGPVRKQVADEEIAKIVEDLRGSQKATPQVALLHFANDPSDYFTDTLRSSIEQSGTLDIVDRSAGEKLRNVLRLRQLSYASKEDAAAFGKKRGVNGVLFGRIQQFESFSGGAKIEVEVTLIDSASGDVIFAKRYSKDTSLAAVAGPAIKEEVEKVPWVTRGLAWLVVVLLLPVFTISFIRAMVRKESNRLNGFTLAVYTVVDAILAFLLVGAALTAVVPVVIFMGAAGCALAYNVHVMGWALRLEK